MKSNKLIYVLTTTYFDSKKKGFVHTLNLLLVKAGYKIKTITQHKPGILQNEIIDTVIIKRFKYLPEKYEIKYTIPEAVRDSQVGKLKVLLMIVGFFITTFVECLKKKPALIIGRWAFPSGYIAYIISKIFRIKNVIEIYGSEVTQSKNSRLIRSILIPCMNNSSLVIANSNYSQNEFIKMGVHKEKIIKIETPPNYVTHTSDPIMLDKFKKKFVKEDEKILLFVAHLIELKGAEYAIHALTHITNFKTHLIIAGVGILENNLKNLVKSLGLENRITFFGLASTEEMGLLYDISDVFVCPPIIDSQGFTENLCKTIPEAMESGLPIVATNVGGIPEIIQNEKNGLLVKQKDPKAIAEAVERILTDNSLKNKLITNSKSVVEEFSLEKIQKKYIESINNLLE